MYLASTACAAPSEDAAGVELPPLVAVASLPLALAESPLSVWVGAEESSPYSEVMEAITLDKEGSANTAEET
jgi:hypothetical protein